MTKETDATVYIDGEIPKKVLIINNGEEYEENGKGQIPNHDKIEIIYLDNE